MTTNFSQYFETRIRTNGSSFVTLVDSCPDWLKNAVYDAHQNTPPCDWIFEQCEDAVRAFDNGNLNNEDDLHSYADNSVDIYTKNLYQWAADFCLTNTWAEAESEARDTGMPEETEKRLATIQFFAIRYIAQVMMNACIQAVKETT